MTGYAHKECFYLLESCSESRFCDVSPRRKSTKSAGHSQSLLTEKRQNIPEKSQENLNWTEMPRGRSSHYQELVGRSTTKGNLASLGRSFSGKLIPPFLAWFAIDLCDYDLLNQSHQGTTCSLRTKDNPTFLPTSHDQPMAIWQWLHSLRARACKDMWNGHQKSTLK